MIHEDDTSENLGSSCTKIGMNGPMCDNLYHFMFSGSRQMIIMLDLCYIQDLLYTWEVQWK